MGDCWTWTHTLFGDTFNELEQTIALADGSLRGEEVDKARPKINY